MRPAHGRLFHLSQCVDHRLEFRLVCLRNRHALHVAARPQNSAQPGPSRSLLGFFDAAFRKGVELFQQSDYQGALREFEQALRAEPANAAIENALGLTDSKRNRIAEANGHYEKSIRLDPKSADPHSAG
jgi:Flp pilus assembly protein TadD